jgi:signal transduction histidine kinase
MFSTKEEIYYSVILSSIFFCLLIGILLYSIYLYHQRKKQHTNDQQMFRANLLQAKIEVQENTFNRISHELHDNLGQIASIIKINLNTINLSDSNKAKEKIEFTKDLVRQLITDLKMASLSLNSARVIKSGIYKALEREIDVINKTDEIVATYSVSGNETELGEEKTLIVYRIVQELINNALKHSNATHINLILDISETLFILKLSDDGRGFDQNDDGSQNGEGLINLMSRAKMINADFVINSLPESGTTAILRLPFKPPKYAE